MRFDSVIPFGQHAMGLQVDLSLLLQRDFDPRRIVAGVKQSATSKTVLSLGCPNKLQRGFVTNQWMSSPVLADLRKQAMLNRIPFRSAGWQMRDCDLHVKFISQLLQSKFPQPTAISIGAAAVGFNQQPSAPWVSGSPFDQQPNADDCDGELRSLMRSAKHYQPPITSDIIDAIRNGHAIGVTRIIVFHYVQRLAPPVAPGLLEVANQFALLGIHADDRIASFKKLAALPRHVTHLPVPLRVLLLGQPLTIDAQNVTAVTQQAPNRIGTDSITTAPEFLAQFARGLARPFDPGDRIASRRVAQQFIQDLQDFRVFFSTAWRPPPARRTRLRVSRGSMRLISSRPRQIVLRLRPVISINRWMSPCSALMANSPAKRRRFFSSSPARRRLIARCSSAVSLRGWCWHVSQAH